MGFYSSAVISVENAARVAALHTAESSTSAADSAGACSYVLAEMNPLSNARDLTACDALPLIVTASSVNGPDGAPASRVSVTYRTPALFPIPGLMGRLQITRAVEMRVKD